MRYHVYGVGNALVDMEFATSGDELAQLGVDKGVMTLVEEGQLGSLLSRLDRKPVKRACGGSAANTMIAIAQLGGTAYYSCKIADDAIGHFFLSDLQRNHVQTNLHTESLPAGATGQCLVLVTPDAERSMCTYLGITADLTDEELDPEAIAHSAYVYLEGYLVSSETGRRAAIHAREQAESHRVQTALTLSDPNMVKFFRDGLMEMIGDGVDLLFCNEKEAQLFAGTEDLNGAVATLRNHARRLVITLGARGALVHDGEQEHLVPGRSVTPIDTNGAGDMYAGAFLYAITHGESFVDAARLANAASARLILEYGPRMDAELTREVLDSWKQERPSAH